VELGGKPASLRLLPGDALSAARGALVLPQLLPLFARLQALTLLLRVAQPAQLALLCVAQAAAALDLLQPLDPLLGLLGAALLAQRIALLLAQSPQFSPLGAAEIALAQTLLQLLPSLLRGFPIGTGLLLGALLALLSKRLPVLCALPPLLDTLLLVLGSLAPLLGTLLQILDTLLHLRSLAATAVLGLLALLLQGAKLLAGLLCPLLNLLRLLAAQFAGSGLSGPRGRSAALDVRRATDVGTRNARWAGMRRSHPGLRRLARRGRRNGLPHCIRGGHRPLRCTRTECRMLAGGCCVWSLLRRGRTVKGERKR
jgi:hypothetical protein